MVMPTALPRFDLLQFEALILSQISGHLTVCFEDDLVNTATSVPSYVCQLDSRFIDNGRYLGDLLGRQIQFPTEPVPHSAVNYSGVRMKFEKRRRACISPKNAPVIPPAMKTRRKPVINFHCNARFMVKIHPESPNLRWRIHL